MSFPIIPKLNSAPGAGAPATLTLGELAANRSTAKLYMGTDTGVQELAFSGSLGGTAISTFTAAGGTSFAPLAGYTSTSVDAYLVSVGGIEQRPTVDWTISSAAGGTVVFATAPPSGATIVVRAVVAGSGGGSGGTDIGGRAWSGTETYTEGDLVATSQRETWICIANDNTGNDPTTSPDWWAPQPADAVSLQLRPLASTAPTDGQLIAWSSINNTWFPKTLGAGINWKGQWDYNQSYETSDVVSQDGSSYIALIPNGGANPSDPNYASYWSLLAAKGEQGTQGDQGDQGDQGQGFNWCGTWDYFRTYYPYDIVFYESDPYVGAYICISQSQTVLPPSDAKWNRFA